MPKDVHIQVDEEMQQEESSIGFSDDEGEDEIPDNIPRRLVTQPFDFSVRTLVAQIDDGSLDLEASFQRKYIWDTTKASRLIESLLLNIPIPVCYFAEEETGVYTVIDGHQRLGSIVKFIKGEYSLRGLKARSDLKGLKFNQLDSKDQRIIFSRTLRCIVITQESHPEIRFDVFERLNTGSVMLNPQELRNCIYRGDLNDLLKKLTKDSLWLKCIGKKQPDARMKDQELILRFFTLNDGYARYNGGLRNSLNEYMRHRRKMTDSEKQRLEDAFFRAIRGAFEVFGEKAFRRPKGDSWEDQINRALFDVIMISFSQIDITYLKKYRIQIVNSLRELIIKSDDFKNAIDRATGDRSRLHTRLRMWSICLSNLGIDTAIHRELDAI